jgi:hypothetical protein
MEKLSWSRAIGRLHVSTGRPISRTESDKDTDQYQGPHNLATKLNAAGKQFAPRAEGWRRRHRFASFRDWRDWRRHRVHEWAAVRLGRKGFDCARDTNGRHDIPCGSLSRSKRARPTAPLRGKAARRSWVELWITPTLSTWGAACLSNCGHLPSTKLYAFATR